MDQPAAGLRIQLFGHAGASIGDVPVRFAKRATTLSLLAYLILKDGAPVARSTLAFTLFADEPEENALAELRRYLYLASKSLPAAEAPWITADAETVRWSGGDGHCRVDVVEFSRLARNPAGYAEAVALYAGDLLEDVYDDWVIERRESFRSQYLDMLAQLVAACRRTREHSQAIAYAQRLLAADPWREDVLRGLMAVRYAIGDSAGALAEYARFAARLHDEMRESPMPETTAVRDAIRANAPLPGEVTERREPPARRADRPYLAFSGRAAELERLHALWRRAARGHGMAVLIGGEGGIGKTRLCGELAHLVESEGGRVFAGGTSAAESIPYQSLVEALRSALALLAPADVLTPARTALLARVLPELRDAERDSAAKPSHDDAGENARLLEAIADAVVALARPRPLLLVLEDLHWAGSATLEAFARVARRAENAPLLVLTTYRDEEVGPAHALRALTRELRAEQRLSTVELGRLERSDVESIVSAFDMLSQRDGDVADRLYRHTEGNPLFLSETIAELVERRHVEPTPADGVAAGIARIIQSRTAELGEEARAVAEVAAVAGYGCNAELVQEVTALAPGVLSAAFNELLDRRILRDAATRYDGDYVFTHHLIAAAVYAGIDPATRKRRHARIAHVLERTSAGRAAVAGDLARHYDAAELPQQAARWYAEAARESASVFALDEAIGFASRALELETDPVERIELLRRRETWRGRRGNRDGQRADIDALATLVDSANHRERFDLLRRRMLLARSLGESDAELALIDEMAVAAERSDDARLRAETLLQRASFAVSLSRHAEAREPAAAALAHFERLGEGPNQVACLSLLVDIAANVGDDAATRTYLETLRERASTQADRAIAAQALRVAAQAALLAQKYSECRELTREVLPLTQRLGDVDAEALAHVRIAVTSAWLEEFDEAERGFDRAVEILETTGNKRALAIALTNRVLMEMRLGRFAEAQRLIDRSNRLCETVRERRTIVVNANNLSFIRFQLGDTGGALHWARVAYEGAREIAFPVFEAAALSNLGNAERGAGRLVTAIDHMEAGMALRRIHQAPDDYADDLADLCATYAQAGRARDALRCAREIETLARNPLGGAFWPHFVLYCASKGFATAGDRAKAREFSKRALSELERFAAALTDPAKRASFLAIPANLEIARLRHARALRSPPT